MCNAVNRSAVVRAFSSLHGLMQKEMEVEADRRYGGHERQEQGDYIRGTLDALAKNHECDSERPKGDECQGPRVSRHRRNDGNGDRSDEHVGRRRNEHLGPEAHSGEEGLKKEENRRAHEEAGERDEQRTWVGLRRGRGKHSARRTSWTRRSGSRGRRGTESASARLWIAWRIILPPARHRGDNQHSGRPRIPRSP